MAANNPTRSATSGKSPAPAESRRLWAHEPVLRRRSSGYAGRILVEAWSDGATRIVVQNPGVLQAVQQALGSTSPVRLSRAEFPNGPITGGHDGGDFLGRVIVEVWEDGAVVGLLGADESLLLKHVGRALGSSAIVNVTS